LTMVVAVGDLWCCGRRWTPWLLLQIFQPFTWRIVYSVQSTSWLQVLSNPRNPPLNWGFGPDPGDTGPKTWKPRAP
jgi:hypothetical protein